MRRRRYTAGLVNPFLPTEVYEAKRQAMLTTGSTAVQPAKTARRNERVVSIRVNPIDCLSVLDVLDKQGISTTNMSFAQAVKIVLASALETFRQMNYIPTPDGFAFLDRMEVFRDDNNRVAMLNITANSNHPDYKAQPVVESYETKQRRIRYEELVVRKKGDPLNWTPEDQQELMPLAEEFF